MLPPSQRWATWDQLSATTAIVEAKVSTRVQRPDAESLGGKNANRIFIVVLHRLRSKRVTLSEVSLPHTLPTTAKMLLSIGIWLHAQSGRISIQLCWAADLLPVFACLVAYASCCAASLQFFAFQVWFFNTICLACAGNIPAATEGAVMAPIPDDEDVGLSERNACKTRANRV